jgi:hypothetical protein
MGTRADPAAAPTIADIYALTESKRNLGVIAAAVLAVGALLAFLIFG